MGRDLFWFQAGDSGISSRWFFLLSLGPWCCEQRGPGEAESAPAGAVGWL